MTHVRIIAAHEIGDATTAADAGHHAPTKGAELAKTLLDIDGREVAQNERSREFFLGVLVLFGINGHGIGGADALVARARIAHHGDQSTAHTRITGRSGGRNDVRKDAVAKDAVAQRTVHRLA